MKALLKQAARAICLVLAFPAAVISGFGRFRAGFVLCGQAAATMPGLPGDYLRAAFYWLTLRQFGAGSRVSFGTFFSTSDLLIGERVYIGAYCVIGRARIGRNTQIASHVQILSGSRQHARDEQGEILGGEVGQFSATAIGANVWIGAAAVIMADVGERTTVGAGSIVTRELPAGVVAVGNPARVIRAIDPASVSSATFREI
jgi:virginiamycin A acetyltransferase